MAKFLLLLHVYSVSTSLLLLNNIIGNSNGLTLELIHPNTQESYFFQSNFSYEERIQRLVSQSIHRTNYLINSLSKTVSKNITFKQEFLHIARPLVDLQEFNYIVKIGIGTFKFKPPFQEYYLDMDTGSALTWIQCEGCTKCFKQKPKPFPKNKSTSFHPILDENKKPLPYNMRYQDGSNSSGIIAKETIHLNSNNLSMKSVQDFIFGCGLVNNMEYGQYKNNRVAGIMGLGWGTYSFVNQIRESKGRFSYCLPLVNLFTKIRPKTYLRFGDDIVEGRQKASSTTMMTVEGVGTYYVGLQGISINKKRLNISKHVFDGPNGYKGGCIIDSGTPYSRIIEPAYLKLKEGLEDYFSKNKNLHRISGDLGLDLCYERRIPEGFKNLPEITFHFQGLKAGILIRPEGGFEVAKRFKSFKFREYFCLAMISSKLKSVIGAHQQTNQRIIYDTQKKKLMFHPEDCFKNA